MVESGAQLVCPLCHHPNPSGAHFCQQCGAPLNSGTTTIGIAEHASHVSKEPELSKAPAGVSSRYWVDEHTVGLHVTGYPQPIMIRDARDILLGRAVGGETPPTVDLSDYHAHLLGVSRKHAVIRAVEAGFVVEDLGSQNGTWLNEQRLSPHVPRPLSHGDQLRLGQLIVFVYLPRRQSTGELLTDPPPAGSTPKNASPDDTQPTGTPPDNPPAS
jgi:hypothetical protein